MASKWFGTAKTKKIANRLSFLFYMEKLLWIRTTLGEAEHNRVSELASAKGGALRIHPLPPKNRQAIACLFFYLCPQDTSSFCDIYGANFISVLTELRFCIHKTKLPNGKWSAYAMKCGWRHNDVALRANADIREDVCFSFVWKSQGGFEPRCPSRVGSPWRRREGHKMRRFA